MSFTLYLIRHGETEYNHLNILQGRRTNLPLNITGSRQANALALRFEHEQIDLITSSTMLRAVQTANQVHSYHLATPLLECNDFEELDWGDWEGQPYEADKFNDYFKQWKEGKLDLATPGGESPLVAQERVKRGLDWLVDQSKGCKNVILVAHGRLIRIILATVLDGMLETMDKYKHKNTCVNVLECVPKKEGASGWEEFEFKAISLNETWHLDKFM